MSENVIGAALGATWIGFGLIFVWYLLNKTELFENTKFNNGLTASDMRQKFKYFAPALMLGGAAIGWQGGPIIVPIIFGGY